MAQKYTEMGHSKVFLDEYEKLTDKERIYTSSTFSNNKKINNSKTRQVFSNGNLVEEYRDIGNNIVIKNTYQYDKIHNKTSQTEYASDTLTWTMEYDKNNRETKWNIKRNNKVVNDLRKSYNNHGNLINEVAYKNGKVDKNNSFYYELTYDKFNNWTVRKRFNLDGKKISELTRKITYY